MNASGIGLFGLSRLSSQIPLSSPFIKGGKRGIFPCSHLKGSAFPNFGAMSAMLWIVYISEQPSAMKNKKKRQGLLTLPLINLLLLRLA
jgi:hypothetical protein